MFDLETRDYGHREQKDEFYNILYSDVCDCVRVCVCICACTCKKKHPSIFFCLLRGPIQLTDSLSYSKKDL